MDPTIRTRPSWIFLLGLTCLTVAAFAPVRHNDFIRFDDPDYVTENPHVRSGLSFANLSWALRARHSGNWHPVTWISHMLDAQFFGLNPAAQHLVNLAIHTANVLGLFLLLRRFTDAEWRSAFVAACFAVHPLRVESVAWIAERKDVLSLAFLLLSLAAYGAYTRALAARSPRTRLATWYSAALFFFALGLMSKPMLVTAPCLMLLLDVWPLNRWPNPTISNTALLRRLLAEKLPFFLLAVAAAFVTFAVQDRSHAVAAGFPLTLRFENAFVAVAQYLWQTIWPANLAIYYQHPNTRFFAPQTDSLHPASTQWPVALIVLTGLGLAALSGLALSSRKPKPWFAVGWFWFLVSLLPVLGLIQVGGQGRADRYTYIPSIGLFVCVVWGFANFAGANQFRKQVCALFGFLLLTAWTCRTRAQISFWRDNLTLFQHALDVSPDNAVAHCQVGAEMGRRQDYVAAQAQFQAALECDPTSEAAFQGLGFSYEALGRPVDALAEYKALLRIRPWLAWPHLRAGNLLWQAGDRQAALPHYSEAVRLDPNSAETHLRFGLALVELGEQPQGLAELAEAVRVQPQGVAEHTALAETLFKLGRLPQAEHEFDLLSGLSPTNVEARLNLGGIQWRLGRRSEAETQFAQAVRIQPSHILAHYNLAKALAARGATSDAVSELLTAARLAQEQGQTNQAARFRDEAAALH